MTLDPDHSRAHLRFDQINLGRRPTPPTPIRQLRSRMIRILATRTPRQPLARQKAHRPTIVTRQRRIGARLIDVGLIRERSDIARVVRVWPHAFGCCAVPCSTEVAECPDTGPEAADVVVSGEGDGDCRKEVRT